MKADFYLVLNQSDDGVYIEQLSKEELTSRINRDYWGGGKFNDDLPKFFDGQFTKDGTTILKVERVVVPKEVKTVVEYTLD